MVLHHLDSPLCEHDFGFEHDYRLTVSRLGPVIGFENDSISIQLPECRKRSVYNIQGGDQGR